MQAAKETRRARTSRGPRGARPGARSQDAPLPERAEGPRIAVVRQKYRADGGAERAVSQLLGVLDGQPFGVTLLTRRWEGRQGGNVLVCNPPHLGRTTRDWGFTLAVRRQIRRHRFDLVQTNERIPGCDVYRAGDGVHREWLRQRSRVQGPLGRLGTRMHLYHLYLKRAERRLFEAPNLRAVICNSHMVRREILEYFRVDPAKLHVVYNGVDTNRFHPGLRREGAAVRADLGIGGEEPVFVFVGSGFERKGLAQAMAALARLDRGRLLVVGRDKRFARFRQLAARLRLEGHVTFAGVQEDVRPYYGAADALLLPTLYDPFPNVVLEAMASGLPVVTSTKCGGAELVEPAGCGYVCDALDGPGLAEALRRLSDPAHARQLGQIARATVEPYTPEAMRDKMARLYLELLGRAR